MSTSLIETAEGGSLQQKCAEQLAAELQKEAQLRKESEADSANKSRELWLLREKLAQQQALHQVGACEASACLLRAGMCY
jgi:hypothetical protein